MLERGEWAGGAVRSYCNKGYSFDVGVHYVGEVIEPGLDRTIMEQVSDPTKAQNGSGSAIR